MRCISGDAVTGDAAPEAPNPPGFAVEVPGFTGPFRLLADLILEQKVDVCDVPIATVTDGFLRYAKDTAAWNLEEATWFLAICAVLLELKISRLTPKHTELDEEDLLGASPDLAYARSIELRAFRRVAVELARRLEDEAGFFTRDVGPGPEYAHLYPDPMEHVAAPAAGGGRGGVASAAADARPVARDADPLHRERRDRGRGGPPRASRTGARDVPRADGRLRGSDACRGALPRLARAVP